MITRWADQYKCDRCRKLGPVLHFDHPPDRNSDGWVHFPGIPMPRPDGMMYSDLCDECAALPLGEVMKDPATIEA